jgi:uncharacterized protein (TIGR03435 family)
MNKGRVLVGASIALATLVPAMGQTAIQFDAATIKLDQMGPGPHGMKGGPGTTSPGRVTWQKVWLRDLVAAAFHVDPGNVSGPDWIARSGGQLYAFTATMPPGTNKHEFELMLQKFLTEQFKMQLHHEPRMFPSYELVIAPGGPRLKAAADPNAPDSPVATAREKIGDDGFFVFSGHGERIAANQGVHAKFQSYTMPEFAEHLMNWVTPQAAPPRYVTDKTGLPGKYDFTLKFDDDENSFIVSPQVQAAMGAARDAATVARDGSEPGSGLPNIFKALEQQLGLKLVRAKDIPLDTIVIDHAERIPAGN